MFSILNLILKIKIKWKSRPIHIIIVQNYNANIEFIMPISQSGMADSDKSDIVFYKVHIGII